MSTHGCNEFPCPICMKATPAVMRFPGPVFPSPLEEAAKNYVAARIANDAAEPRDWSHNAALVDMTWHELLMASGLLMEVEP